MTEQSMGLIDKTRKAMTGFWSSLAAWPASISVTYSAIYILLVYRNNVFDVPPGEIVAPIVLAAAYVYFAYYAFKFLLSKRASTELATFLFTLASVHFGTIFNWLRDSAVDLLGYEPNDVLMGGLLIFLLFSICWLAGVMLNKWEGTTQPVLKFLQASLYTFLGVTITSIAYFYVANWGIFTFDTPSIDINPVSAPTDLPDIYYFVFDRYANNATLENYMDYSNDEFIEDLKNRGFLMNEVEHSSYPYTATALATNLNMEYADTLTAGLPPKYSEMIYARMINQSRVVSEFQENGYEVNWSGSWWGPTRTNKQADNNFDDIFKAKVLGAEFTVANWQELLMGQHVLGRIMAADFPIKRDIFYYKQPQQEDIVNFQFDNVRRAVDSVSENPQFSYFHMLTPHPLYVFDEDCSKPSYEQVSAPGDPKQVEKYVNQLKCLNSKILNALDYILDNSPVPPIIVIQPDEGPYHFALEDGQKLDAQEKARWKHGVLSAIYLPEDTRPEKYSVGSVAAMANIFNEYLGYDLSIEPASFYNYVRSDPYNFKNITELIESD